MPLKSRMNRAMYGLLLGILLLVHVTLSVLGSKSVSVSEVILVFLAVPRLHDIGKSGWFVLVGLAVEVAGIVIGSSLPLEQAQSVFALTSLVIAGLMIWLGVIPGSPDPNHWGEPPEPGLSRTSVTMGG
jgi:uncharacterized membrane protein YhaH (DUF805 family)